MTNFGKRASHTERKKVNDGDSAASRLMQAALFGALVALGAGRTLTRTLDWRLDETPLQWPDDDENNGDADDDDNGGDDGDKKDGDGHNMVTVIRLIRRTIMVHILITANEQSFVQDLTVRIAILDSFCLAVRLRVNVQDCKSNNNVCLTLEQLLSL